MKKITTLTIFLIFLCFNGQTYAQDFIHHDLKIRLQPAEKHIQVTDTLTIPEVFLGARPGRKAHFILHGGLKPQSQTVGAKLVREKEPAKPEHLGINTSSFAVDASIALEHFSLVFPSGKNQVVLHYQGQIDHPLTQQGEEYARSFSETPGLIGTDGVYLAGATYWYPKFNDDLVTFNLDLDLPSGWDAISQGRRARHERSQGATRVRWESPEPQDEIYLSAGQFTEYSRAAGAAQALVFLRTPDDDLANKYLETTAQYLELYRQLIGPYPYSKFALVENFWETGYGMPSFTLLGPRVIRFPFILHSSYPHEILHNYWGNSVFVDYPSGNWCEGLTAYLADHLVQEQRGAGADYRRATLQKYTDYVAQSQDFPLTEFRSRHSSATEAVGYGKSLLFFHMLRRNLGDELFKKGLQTFYRNYKYRQASFGDLQKTFSEVSGQDLAEMFSQWITRIGAPELRVTDVTTRANDTGFQINAKLEQIQAGAAYRLQVPLAIHLDGQKSAYQTTVAMDGKQLELSLSVPARPLRLEVDPEFDLFRRLNRNETPPALSQAFGSEKALLLVSAAAPDSLRQAMLQLGEAWSKSQTGQLEIKLDTQVDSLPEDRAVWLLGWDNRFRDQMIDALAEYDISIGANLTRLGKQNLARAEHALLLCARQPANPDQVLVWLTTENPRVLPGLARKLPHYGKYSYLGFEGDEPTNILKGQWPAIKSPMSVLVQQPDGFQPVETGITYASRKALAELPSVFSEERMRQDIRFLASDSLQGRGFGSPGLEQAADYIAGQFRMAGLRPGGTDGTWFQTWQDRGGKPERDVILKNVIGIIPGNRPEWSDQSVVIGAHYDHLGLGWPDVHQGDAGKIHPGADDNASGVAVLLELARVLARTWQPDRTVIFIAFSAEEAGLRGSNYYVNHPSPGYPLEKCLAMLNLDTVGRLGTNKLTVFGTGSAREWSHIFMGTGFVTGVPIETIASDLGGSDQKSFLAHQVPAVQLFSGLHPDYHRPSDTWDKIDSQGLVKVAMVAKEALEYLAGRQDFLTATAATKTTGTDQSPTTPGARKVSLGTVPDFGYNGKGLRISGVTPGSPAEKAGLLAGDIILQLNNGAVENLAGFSNLLKALQPGDSVRIVFSRNGQELSATAVLAER